MTKGRVNNSDTDEILEQIPQCVISTDLNGVVTYWNAASEYIFGYSREEMLGRSLITIYPSFVEGQFQNDLERLNAGEKVKGQWKSITKEGSIIWVDVLAMPLMDDDGKPVEIIATAHNIQELKKVEKELEENKALAQAILETTVDGIITIDEKGMIISFNQAASRIFGYSEEEALGENIKILMPEPHRREHDDYLGRYCKTGEKRIIGQRRELAGCRKDGSVFPMELSVSEVKWNDTRIFTGVVNDISERRRLEQEILRVSEEERRSLGQDLHDGLGQMLTGISLISQNLARKLKSNGIPGADEVREISNLIKEADEYAKSLAHGLVHVDVEDEGIHAALDQLTNQAKKFFKINCSYQSDRDAEISNSIKATNLYRIAQEAVSNAVKHGKAENVQIKLKADNGLITLSIKDDGIGFARSLKAKKKKGMGINIMKYRANMMSGNLEIFETENNQTKVVCSIPYANVKTGGPDENQF